MERRCTGFPIIDAGMRQLNKTGYMHGRVRMLTALSGKKYGHRLATWRTIFAEKLMDFDLASNNGNWQWVDEQDDAAPYFRIFNPITQQKQYDPNLIYCKKYIDDFENYTKNTEPIVDLKLTRMESIERYKRCLSNEKVSIVGGGIGDLQSLFEWLSRI